MTRKEAARIAATKSKSELRSESGISPEESIEAIANRFKLTIDKTNETQVIVSDFGDRDKTVARSEDPNVAPDLERAVLTRAFILTNTTEPDES